MIMAMYLLAAIAVYRSSGSSYLNMSERLFEALTWPIEAVFSLPGVILILALLIL